MASDQIVRCSDGHYYTAKWVPLVGLRSVRLGPGRRLARCPVDKHWRMTTQVDPTELTEAQRAEADHHHAGLQ